MWLESHHGFQLLKITAARTVGLFVGLRLEGFTSAAYAAIPGWTLDPIGLPKCVTKTI